MNKTLIVILLIASFSAGAQEKLTDINEDIPRSSFPRQFFSFNNDIYFLANTQETGTEIWKSDGTSGATSLLKDIKIGAGSSFISKFIEHNGKMYFIADDGIYANQLWVTDGTTHGTKRVTRNISAPADQITSNGEFIFYLKKSGAFLQVWKTDGTEAGTFMVKGDIPSVNQPANLTSASGLVFFSAQDPTSSNTKVWRSDGTEAGTFPVISNIDGNGAESGGTAHPYPFFEYNGTMYFIARDIYQNPMIGLYKSDGTVAGTSRVSGLDIGHELVAFSDIIEHSGKMYFSFFKRDSNNLSIWKSDGTQGNTREIYAYTASGYFATSTLCPSGQYLFFTSGNANNGTSLIKLNTDTYESQEVVELSGPRESPFIAVRVDVNEIVATSSGGLFIKSIIETFNYAELWKSDATTVGTYKLAHIERTLDDLILHNDQVYFTGSTDTRNYELWKSDGTLDGTTIVKDVDPSKLGATFSQPPRPGGEGRLLFTCTNPSFGYEPWVTDGTASGTTVIDLVAGTVDSSPFNIVYRNGYWFFLARSASGNIQFFQSDGTREGTVMIADLTAENIVVRYFLGVAGNRYLFSGNDRVDLSDKMYAIDLTSGTYAELQNFSGVMSIKGDYAIVGSNVFFSVYDIGVDLWKTDGTPEGTVKVADRNSIGKMAAAGGLLYFVDEPVRLGPETELYKSDGTLEGTVLVKDINGTASGSPENLFAFDQKLVFTAVDANAGKEVWITDGSAENTVLLKDIFPGPARSITSPWYHVVNNHLYFAANDGTHGTELWKSDGTAVGTVMVKDILPGEDSSMPVHMTEAKGKLYFSAFTADTGYELWTSDGTPEGTELYFDLATGPQSSNPRDIIMLGDKLLFIAYTESTGTQAWSYTESVTAIVDQERPSLHVFPNPSSGIFRIDGAQIACASLTVYNAQGHLVSTMQNIHDNSEINLTHLSPGLYVMKFSNGRRTETVKVVKW